MIALRLAGIVWSLPLSLIGLVWSLVCRPSAARWNGADLVLEIRVAWLPMKATGETLGHVILFRTDTPETIRAHELVHVWQASLLGPIFVLAYPLASLVAVIAGGHFYRDQFFERQARRRSGQG